MGKGFDCYCDADFSGIWNKHLALYDLSTDKSCSGWILFYTGYLVIWASKLQIQAALSTTEAEYIPMSQSQQDIHPVMFLVQEFGRNNFQSTVPSPTYTARSLKITLVDWNSQGFQNFVLVPGTSTYAIIIFAHM
jgi:hypothetical protein